MRMKTFRPYAADAMRSNMRNDDQGGRANLPGSPRKSADRARAHFLKKTL